MATFQPMQCPTKTATIASQTVTLTCTLSRNVSGFALLLTHRMLWIKRPREQVQGWPKEDQIISQQEIVIADDVNYGHYDVSLSYDNEQKSVTSSLVICCGSLIGAVLHVSMVKFTFAIFYF